MGLLKAAGPVQVPFLLSHCLIYMFCNCELSYRLKIFACEYKVWPVASSYTAKPIPQPQTCLNFIIGFLD